jgi:hypothetical protein
MWNSLICVLFILIRAVFYFNLLAKVTAVAPIKHMGASVAKAMFHPIGIIMPSTNGPMRYPMLLMKLRIPSPTLANLGPNNAPELARVGAGTNPHIVPRAITYAVNIQKLLVKNM